VIPALIELLCMHCAMQAAGAAYALKRRAVQNVAVCYFGDGAASEGVCRATTVTRLLTVYTALHCILLMTVLRVMYSKDKSLQCMLRSSSSSFSTYSTCSWLCSVVARCACCATSSSCCAVLLAVAAHFNRILQHGSAWYD
jgi:Dehydrogenase E1 component